MNKMKIEEVAVLIGVSTQTLNRWYKFKRDHPESELAKSLPEYSFETTSHGNARVWDTESIWSLINFKSKIQVGRNGRMGKYGGRGTNGEKKIRSRKTNDT